MSFTVSSVFIICAVFCGLFYLLLWHFRRRNLYKLASKFRGPFAIPIIGNAHLFIGNAERILYRLKKLSETYSSPFRVWLGPRLFIFVTDPDQAKTVLLSSKTLSRGDVLEFAEPFFGTGLFTAPAEKWQIHRKLIQPTFNQKILESFVEIFSEQSKIFTEQLAKNLNGEEFDIFNLVASCTLDMICETAIGVKVNAQTNGNFSYVEALQGIMVGFCKRFFHIWLHPDFIFYRTKTGRDQIKYIKLMHEFTDNVIRAKRKELLDKRSDNSTKEIHDDDSKLEKKAFLDHLLKLSDGSIKLSDEEIRDEVNTMIVTGNDTSAITITHLILMLASHPEVQEKAYQEIYEIYGNQDIDERPVISKDLPRMKYMERVMKETMRLFPIAPVLVRSVSDDLKIGEYTIPNKTSAVISILRMHRDPKYWSDPLKFQPDRFLPEENLKRHPYIFLGFSGGPRNCIGFNYAMMSLKAMMATLLRKYILIKDNIVEVKDIKLKVEILMKTVEPVKIRIEKRPKGV